MPIVKDGRVVEDAWQAVDDETPLPAGGPVLVSSTRWAAERDTLLARNAPLGVRLGAGEPAETIAEDIGRLQLIALPFPTFRDGRAFSTARILRERYGYAGELRAVGDVLRDQLLFMVRCGFDALEIDDADAAATWAVEMARFSVVYQPTADARRPAAALRRLRQAAE